MPTIEKLDKEIAIYKAHMHQLYDGTAPPSCYRGGISAASAIYDSKKNSGTRLDVLACPYDLAVIVEHDFADDDLEVTTCAEYNSVHWSQYHRLKVSELQNFITDLFDVDNTVSLGHRFFPILRGILSTLNTRLAQSAVPDAPAVL